MVFGDECLMSFMVKGNKKRCSGANDNLYILSIY